MGTAAQNSRELEHIGGQTPRRRPAAVTVRHLLERKRRAGAVTIEPGDSVYNALRLMAEHDVGALVVASKGRPAGVISERDYARKVILIGKSSRETTVAEIMSAPAVTVGLDTTVAECMALMTGRYLRHLPVVAEGMLVGCISIGDVVKSVIEEQEDRLGQFEAYIRDSYPA